MKKKNYSQMNTAQIVAEIQEAIRLIDAIDASYGRWFSYDRDYDKHEYGSSKFYRLKINRCEKVADYLARLGAYLDRALHSVESKAAGIKEVLDHRKEREKKYE